MKLSDQQAQWLLVLLGDSLVLQDNGQVFKLSRDQRLRLFNEILAQQYRNIRDIHES